MILYKLQGRKFSAHTEEVDVAFPTAAVPPRL